MTNKEVDVYTKNLAVGIHKGDFIVEQPLNYVEGYPKLDNPQTTLKFVGVFAKTRREWTLSLIALMRDNITVVPFFDSLGPKALAFVIN